MELFRYQAELNKEASAPLAYRMRPRNLNEFAGQQHILSEGSLLRRAILADRLGSVIFYGPPGCGKTALSRIISETTKAHFVKLNAVTSGVADLRNEVAAAKDRLGMYGTGTILFIDEIHRFNKSQQDAILPHVEDGTITLIGATTENPFFEVNAALISRSRIFQFKPLEPADIESLLRRALTDKERGLGEYNTVIDDDTMAYLADLSGGDARNALNALELAVLTTTPDAENRRVVTKKIVEDSVQRRTVRYDKQGDNHYDIISAFIKSMRGSDPQAALYWLARMIDGGEDPKFIARRIVICAAEDVGLADPNAVVVANACSQVVQFVGMPEARIPLAEAALYVATAPKSNRAYMGIDKALAFVRSHREGEVPLHLKDAHYKGGRTLGHGVGYQYPHDDPRGFVPQQYLPTEAADEVFYEPSTHGREQVIKDRLQRLDDEKKR